MTTTNTTEINLLDHLAVIQLDVKIWSARKKLTPEDLGNAELPPEDLASIIANSVVAELIKTAFSLIPARGAIDGGTLIMLQGLVALLRTPADLLEHAQKILDGHQKPDDMLNGFIGTFKAPATDAVATQGVATAEEEMPEAADEASLSTLESCGLW